MSRQHILVLAAFVLLLLLAISGLHPYDRLTWWMEVAPVLIALPILIATHRRFPLTSLVYALVFVHAVILIVGGTYTYARVLFGFWLEALLHTARKPYDQIGHFTQGLVPALAAPVSGGISHGTRARRPGLPGA